MVYHKENFKLNSDFPACGTCSTTTANDAQPCPNFNGQNVKNPFMCDDNGNCQLLLGRKCEDNTSSPSPVYAACSAAPGLTCNLGENCKAVNGTDDAYAKELEGLLNSANPSKCPQSVADALKKDSSHLLLYAMLILLLLVVGGVLLVMHNKKKTK